MPVITISSLSMDSGAIAPQIATALSAQYNARNVTLLEALPQPAVRYKALERAEVVIVVIGPQWLHLMTAMTGVPSNAVARSELEVLLRGPQTRLVLPLLVEGATTPPATALPPGLQPLAYLQALWLQNGPGFADDMQLVTTTIGNYFKQARATRQAAGNYLWFKALSVLPLVLLLAFFLVILISPGSSSTQPTDVEVTLVLVLFASILITWVLGFAIALATQRYRWAVMNAIIGLPLCSISFLLIAAYNVLRQGGQGTLANVVNLIAFILLALSLFLWPVIFGFTLPPYFRRRIAQ